MNDVENKLLKLYIFYCSNSFNNDDLKSILMEEDDEEHKFISLPCSGKANLLYFLKAFETGADGLILITCSKNECRYLEGNLRSPKRAEGVNQILEEIGMGIERVTVFNTDGNGLQGIAPKITEFRNRIKTISAK